MNSVWFIIEFKLMTLYTVHFAPALLLTSLSATKSRTNQNWKQVYISHQPWRQYCSHKVKHRPEQRHKVTHQSEQRHKVTHQSEQRHKVMHQSEQRHKVTHQSEQRHKVTHQSELETSPCARRPPFHRLSRRAVFRLIRPARDLEMMHVRT